MPSEESSQIVYNLGWLGSMEPELIYPSIYQGHFQAKNETVALKFFKYFFADVFYL